MTDLQFCIIAGMLFIITSIVSKSGFVKNWNLGFALLFLLLSAFYIIKGQNQ